MLKASFHCRNDMLQEGNAMPRPIPRMRLRSPDLLRTLMQHTGDGTRATVRDLATAAEVAPSHIGELLTGTQATASAATAASVAARIGVDLLVIWEPAERTATGAPDPSTVTLAAVSDAGAA